MWDDLFVEGAIGSEGGLILADEAYKDVCRITLEDCGEHYAITCGVYGAMVHTTFAGGRKTYDEMKKELQDFIDRDTTKDEEYEFYSYFIQKF